VPLAFLAAITAGTVLLYLPIATLGPQRPPLLPAAFTSISAVCVTGLTTVDTATIWSLARPRLLSNRERDQKVGLRCASMIPFTVLWIVPQIAAAHL
jgi:hypothetical protein